MRDRVPLTPSQDMKHEILEKLAKTMYSFKAYPDDDDFSSVAKALISKHPGLTEPGPQPGWYGWKNSLKFKMANYRTKLRKAECDDVMINGGKRSKHNREGPSSSKNIKRPRRGEANYLSNLPDRHDESSLENAIEEMKKKQANASLVSRMMEETFSLRKREIVTQEPAAQSMMERWPALFTERQIFAEFNRIASKNLEGDFYEALDQHTPRFIDLLGQKLTDLMQHINWMDCRS
uniref:uncharacterized protein LOC124064377 n=1 Tax=Scatophagus argus TaxID=75038 RepID=UPI001ED82617|nr:uncharacterized protein LOC124064377 [Scatophagus argus]